MGPVTGSVPPDPKLAEMIDHFRAMSDSRPSIRLGKDKPARTQETIRRILAASHDVFVKEGYAGLSVRKVSEKAGIANGNLSYHFPTKSELIHATLEECLAQYIDKHLTHISLENQTPKEILLEFVGFYSSTARDEHRFFYQTWGFAATTDEAREIVRSLYEPIGRFLLYLVRAARPDLDFDRAQRLVAQISALEEGYRVLIGLGPDDNPALLKSEIDVRAITEQLLDSA